MKPSDVFVLLGKMVMDGVMIFSGLLLTYFVRMHHYEFLGLEPPTAFPLQDFAQSGINITLFLLFLFILQGHYRFRADEKILQEVHHIFWSFASGLSLLIVTFFFLQKFFFSRFIFGAFLILGFFCLFFGRTIIRGIRLIFYHYGQGKTSVLILGSQNIARQTLEVLQKNKKYHLVGILSEDPKDIKSIKSVPLLGTFKDLEKILKEKNPEEVILALRDASEKINSDMVRLCYLYGARFSYMPDELGLDLASVQSSTLGGHPLIILKNTHLEGWGLFLKTFLDFVFGVIIFILVSPIMLVTAFLVWRENPRAAIIYRSKRVGKNGKIFNCLKFRTMIPDADQKKKDLLSQNERKGGILFKIEKDPRITKIGHLLRKTSLDEFPQIFNVLRGEMSLIGPRPHLPEEVEKYRKNDLRVLSIKPGMSGFAQINGRSKLSFEEEMKYELFYIQNWSLWLDILIFFKTIWIVLHRKNVS